MYSFKTRKFEESEEALRNRMRRLRRASSVGDLAQITHQVILSSVTREKSPNVHKSCPEMISLEKLKILAPTQKLHKTGGDLEKLIVAKGFKKLPKVQ